MFAVGLRMFVDRAMCVCATKRQMERERGKYVFCIHTVYSGARVLYCKCGN